MTSKVFRLYREIDKSLPDKRPYDMTYVRERQEVFEMLQPISYDKQMRSLSRTVEPLKHHGRTARLRADVNMRRDVERQREKELEQRMQENHMRAILQEYRDNGKAIVNMQKCIEDHRPIPARTVQTLFAKDSRAYEIKNLILKGELDVVKEVVSANGNMSTSTNSPPRRLPPLENNNALKSPPANRPMPCFQQPTIVVDNRREFDRTKTKTKWSLQERQKLNELYREIPLPQPNAQLEIWSIYFDKVAARFIVFYPERTKSDVREKLKTMITKRQLKEAGEVAYWQEMQGKIAHKST